MFIIFKMVYMSIYQYIQNYIYKNVNMILWSDLFAHVVLNVNEDK